jgi:CheY-like chemotaxis protein
MIAEKPINFLLVDDLEENLLALEALLQREGLTCLKARSGEEALELLLVHDVALALLDVQMPGMDGFELAEFMRGAMRTRHVPIIFLTAADRDSHLALRGYAAGAVDYLTKPFDPWVLRAKVSVFVELWTMTQQLAAQSDLVRTRETELRAAGAAVDEATALLKAALAADGELVARQRPTCRKSPTEGCYASWIIRALRRPVMSRTRMRKAPTLIRTR